MKFNFVRFLKNVFIVFGLFVLLYNPPILKINIMHIVGVVSWLLIFLQSERIKIFFRLKGLFITYVLLFGYLLTITIIRGAEFSTTLAPIYFIADVIPFSIVFSLHILKEKKDIQSVFNYFIVAGIIQSSLALMAFLIPSIQSFFANRLIAYGYGNIVNDLSFRTFGFSGELTFAMPIIQAIIAIICFSKHGIIFKFLSFLILASGVINARVSIVIFAIGFITFLIFSKDTFKQKFRIVFVFFMILVFGILVILPFVKSFSFETYKWIMDGFKDLSFLFGGEKSKYSYIDYVTNTENYNLPSTFFSLIFGTGYPSLGFYEKLGFASDVGYINDIWQGGLFYSIFLYSFYLYVIWQIIKSNVNSTRWLGLTFLFGLFVANIKGPIFGMNAATVCLVIFYIFIKTQKIEIYSHKKVGEMIANENNYCSDCLVQQ